MDRWAWQSLEPWSAGVLVWVLRGPTRGRPRAAAGIRSQAPQRRSNLERKQG